MYFGVGEMKKIILSILTNQYQVMPIKMNILEFLLNHLIGLQTIQMKKIIV